MDWLEWGYLGLFVVTFLSPTVIPFASEAIVIAAILGGFNPWAVLIVASSGNTLGGISSYGIGWFAHWERFASKMKRSREKIEKWKPTIDRYGPFTALLCWAPIVGDVIALALGFFRTRPSWVFIWMWVGKSLRYAIVIWSTWSLSQPA